jgi:hypothetical protein
VQGHTQTVVLLLKRLKDVKNATNTALQAIESILRRDDVTHAQRLRYIHIGFLLRWHKKLHQTHHRSRSSIILDDLTFTLGGSALLDRHI